MDTFRLSEFELLLRALLKLEFCATLFLRVGTVFSETIRGVGFEVRLCAETLLEDGAEFRKPRVEEDFVLLREIFVFRIDAGFGVRLTLLWSLKVLLFWTVLALLSLLFKTLEFTVCCPVERRCAIAGVDVIVITAARVIIVANSLNSVVFIAVFFNRLNNVIVELCKAPLNLPVIQLNKQRLCQKTEFQITPFLNR